jgi:hypothetical protein
MIRIVTADNSLKLLPKTNIRFEMPSPLFDFDSIIGTYSFPLNVPTKPNYKALGFNNLTGNKADLPENVACHVLLHNNEWLEGTIKVNNVQNGQTSIALLSSTGHFGNIIKFKKLSDLALGGIRDIGPALSDIIDHANDTTSGTASTYDYVFFPYKNPDFYGDTNPDYGGYVNEWDHDNQTFFYNTATNKYCISPCIYIVYLIQQIFEEHGFTVSGSFLEDPEIRQLVLYNNTALEYNNGAPLNEFNRYLNLQKHIPQATIADFLIGLRKLFALDFHFHRTGKHVEIRTLKSIINIPKYTDWTGKSSRAGLQLTQNFDGYKLSFSGETNNTRPNPKELTGFVHPPSLVFPSSPAIGDAFFNPFWGYFGIYQSTGWDGGSEIPAIYPIGNGVKNIDSSISPVWQVEKNELVPGSVSGDYRSIPFIVQKGNSDKFNPNNLEKCDLHMLFYRGLLPDWPNNRLYPHASAISAYHEPGAGVPVQSGDYSLYWHNTYRYDGLYTNFWEPWMNKIHRAKTAQYQHRLNIVDFLNYDYAEQHRIGAVNHLDVNLSVIATDNGFGASESQMLIL